MSPGQEIRALVEFQSLAKRYHVQRLGFHVTKDTRIFVTGGGSRNRTLLQVIADVFQADVYTQSVTNSAAYGAACRAVHAIRAGPAKNYFDMVRAASGFPPVTVAVLHNADVGAVYERMTARYGRLQSLVASGDSRVTLGNGHS